MQRPLTMALVWFFCLGGLGIWFPLYTLYLGENAGLSGSQVGLVMAAIPLMGMIGQPLWGQVADISGSRARVLATLSWCAAAGYAGLMLPSSFAGLVLATCGLALFSTALIPMTVSVTLALAQGAGPHAFGYSRVWGTVGFLVTVQAFPSLLHWFQASRSLDALRTASLSEPGLEIMFPATAALTVVGGILAWTLPRRGAMASRAARGDWRLLLRHGPYVRLLLFALLGYLFLQGPQVFFPLFVSSLGGDAATVSRMWLPMLALEIPLIALSGATLERVGARGLLGIGVVAGGVRWAVCGFASDLAWVWPVQLLHGVVVAGLIIGGPLYVDRVVPERLRSTGQSVLAMIGFGAGGILSNLGTGWLSEHVSQAAPYALGGIAAIVLGLAVSLVLPPPEPPGTT
ncbi:MAG: MFS transporter [Myxococcota bacterium]